MRGRDTGGRDTGTQLVEFSYVPIPFGTAIVAERPEALGGLGNDSPVAAAWRCR